MADPAVPPARIGVLPAREAKRRPRLLAALERAYPARFEPRDEGSWDGLDGIVAIGPDGARALEASPASVPVLLASAEERAETGAVQAITLAEQEALARPLRGAQLTDAHLATLAEKAPTDAPAGTKDASGTVLASIAGHPVWTLAEDRRWVASAPLELDEREALRERLFPGRTLALLALAHFLADLTAGRRFEPGPLRAAIVLDDPNLHWPSYGHVRYRALADHAAEHRYHVSFAMVPLDAWLVHPGAARLFRERTAQLSLCVHGNDHTGPELSRPTSDDEGVALAARALRRMGRLQERTGVPVSRVMVPPHERVSEQAARGLVTCDYDALCTTRPYPWLVSGLGQPWLTRPPEAGPLAGWESVDVVGDGLPVLLRSSFEHPREDLVLRAFLGQPLILYGHHEDLRDGMDLLANAAADVNRLGDVRWGSLELLARGGVETLLDDGTLHLRPRARRVRVELPAGVEEIQVDPSVLGLPADAPVAVRSADGGSASARCSEAIAAAACSMLELECGAARELPQPASVAPHRHVWPLTRRLASEARDRVAAVR
jgi:hypothetical protein